MAGLAAGRTSRLAMLSYAFVVVGVLFAVLVARTRLELALDEHGRMVLTHQGVVRRTVILVGGVHEVVLSSGPARRALVLDVSGRVVAVVGPFSGFWRRDDVLALLAGAGVAVRQEHRLDRAAELEKAYPGSTAWIERSAVRLYGLISLAALASIFFLAWFLEF